MNKARNLLLSCMVTTGIYTNLMTAQVKDSLVSTVNHDLNTHNNDLEINSRHKSLMLLNDRINKHNNTKITTLRKNIEEDVSVFNEAVSDQINFSEKIYENLIVFENLFDEDMKYMYSIGKFDQLYLNELLELRGKNEFSLFSLFTDVAPSPHDMFAEINDYRIFAMLITDNPENTVNQITRQRNTRKRLLNHDIYLQRKKAKNYDKKIKLGMEAFEIFQQIMKEELK